jgi:hypothetical protein
MCLSNNRAKTKTPITTAIGVCYLDNDIYSDTKFSIYQNYELPLALARGIKLDSAQWL